MARQAMPDDLRFIGVEVDPGWGRARQRNDSCRRHWGGGPSCSSVTNSKQQVSGSASNRVVTQPRHGVWRGWMGYRGKAL